MQIRPRRSVLYMPGSNTRALEKAKTIPADALVLDLEDAVAPEQKVAAREQVVAAVKAGGYGRREMVIRINGLDTAWAADDLRAVAGSGADAVCLPKVESATQVEHVAAQLQQHGAPAGMAIWAMVETPKGVLHAAAIAAAHPRLAALLMGTSDLAKELRIPHTPDRLGFIASLSLCVLAARASGVDVLDGVHLDFRDSDGLRAVCEQGRTLGFDGKTLIHPDQVAIANEVFAPDAAAVARARRLLEVWQAAQREGRGVAVLDGKLVENLHAAEAERLLAIAEAVAALG
jgi:citrate lyase subunit beta/citryl-CoA lyase